MSDKKSPNAPHIIILTLLFMFLLVSCITTSSRVNLSPTSMRYYFLEEKSKYQQIAYQVYPDKPPSKPLKVAVAVQYPDKGILKFLGYSTAPSLDLTLQDTYTLIVKSGVYPFQILKSIGKRPQFSGAIVIYNMTKELSLATLGLTPETTIFNQSMLKKAKNGVLGKYTVEFDEEPVLTYWIGNRKKPHIGGKPTVELDFSKIPGITELKIAGTTAKSFIREVEVYDIKKQKSGYIEYNHKEYPFTMKIGGYSYKGFIRTLNANESTSFVRVNCSIPEDLLASARQGTVSKYLIKSEDDEDVAELFLSIQ